MAPSLWALRTSRHSPLKTVKSSFSTSSACFNHQADQVVLSSHNCGPLPLPAFGKIGAGVTEYARRLPPLRRGDEILLPRLRSLRTSLMESALINEVLQHLSVESLVPHEIGRERS